MAYLIPENVDQFNTEGEGAFYRFLEAVAKPDDKIIVWYLPDVNGKEPDFLLYSGSTGLIIFEVKDWNINQVIEADPHYFKLRIGSKIDRRKNPMFQARDYLGEVMDKIKADGRLVSKEAAHRGNPIVPISCGAVFPNIMRQDYIEMGLDAVISARKVFFGDDLHPASDIFSGSSGQGFSKVLLDRFPPPFKFSIKPKDLHRLRQLIFPSIRIDLPERAAPKGYAARIEGIRSLDYQQEALARQFDGGHRIIVGASGSGKTLVLVHKAAFLRQYNPDIHNILFVCYNITLVNYIRRLLSDKSIPLGDNGVNVCHFFQLCSEILGEKIAYENEDGEYYDMVIQEALNKIEKFERRFDAVIVDEGQDFTADMYKVAISLMNPNTNSLTIALDDNQNIYRQKISWKNIGINAQGRVHRLPAVYRNTIEIRKLASGFMDSESDIERTRRGQHTELFQDYFNFHGPAPEIISLPSYEEIVEWTGQKIVEIADQDGCPLSEFAVLYALKKPKNSSNKLLPNLVESALESKGILSNWISESYSTKKAYDITTNSVTISSIHSAKGLDFSCVFLLGVDCLEPKGWSEEQIQRLVYVGLTRARYQLFIPFVRCNSIIKKLQSSL